MSGGHTQIVRVDSPLEMEIIGTTIDDAAGEAFDKCAKVMGLPYPGGPVIDRLAKEGDPKAFRFAHPRVEGYDYSFSGLKTSFLYTLRDAVAADPDFIETHKADLCASLQGTIVEILLDKLIRASKETGIRDIAIAGGVSANSGLRDAIAEHPDIYDMDIMPAESFRNEKFITVGLRNQIAKAREAGIDLPVARTILITGMSEDEIWVNMSRVNGVDPTDPGSYTRGEIEARKQVYRIRKYLRQFVPGFENAWMDRVAPFMGIRESRVTVGKYVLTAEDILACRHFDDAIAVASYPVDLHHPKGGDCTLEYCGDCYDIPYRVLVPEKVENLLVAGRCASFTHEAMASTRVMSTCMALGEAAGRAARIALRDGVKPSQADVAKLRSELKRTGAYLR